MPAVRVVVPKVKVVSESSPGAVRRWDGAGGQFLHDLTAGRRARDCDASTTPAVRGINGALRGGPPHSSPDAWPAASSRPAGSCPRFKLEALGRLGALAGNPTAAVGVALAVSRHFAPAGASGEVRTRVRLRTQSGRLAHRC